MVRMFLTFVLPVIDSFKEKTMCELKLGPTRVSLQLCFILVHLN